MELAVKIALKYKTATVKKCPVTLIFSNIIWFHENRLPNNLAAQYLCNDSYDCKDFYLLFTPLSVRKRHLNFLKFKCHYCTDLYFQKE